MKKINYFAYAIMVVAMLCVSSCSSPSPNEISEKEILEQINQNLEDFAKNIHFTTLKIGTYECNEEYERTALRKLAKAKIVDYNVTRYAWWEHYAKNVKEAYKVKRGNGWYSYYDTEYRNVKKDVYDFQDHYVVDVKLTKSGKRIMEENLPQPKEKVDKDMIQPEINFEKYSWYNLESEKWNEIKNPFINETPVTNTTKEDIIQKEAKKEQEYTENTSSNTPKIERKDEAQYKKYNALNFNSQVVYLETYRIKAAKARNIQILTNSDGERKAVAEVILKTYDVTDAGRIFEKMENDKKIQIRVKLTFYQDKGWVLDDLFD